MNLKNHDESINISSTSFDETLGTQFEVYPIRKIVKCMMYSYGDNEKVVESCVDFILALIYEQLKNLIKKAEQLCKIRGLVF